MLNVRHPPEVHGQVGRAEVQEVEEAELQRHAAVTQHLQSVPLAALLEITRASALPLLLELGCLARAQEEGVEAQDKVKRIHFADLLILKVHLYNLRNALGPMCSYGKCYKCCNRVT